jgi:GTP cyclohydrolase I
VNTARVEALVRDLLVELGEDPEREGLLATPARVARALDFLTSGYRGDLPSIVHRAVFAQQTHNMVIARDIELYSLCEHHVLPFFGRAHIGYISRGRVIGVSKLARLVDHFSRRLQIQERLTEEVAGAVLEAVKADGVGVVIEAQHLCMMMRGVEKQNSMMTTSAVLGSFRRSVATRTEFLTLIGRGHL